MVETGAGTVLQRSVALTMFEQPGAVVIRTDSNSDL